MRKFVTRLILLAVSVFALSYCSKNISLNNVLDRISEQNTRVATQATDIDRNVSGMTSKSKYEALKQLFRLGTAPPPEHFQKEEVMPGKCAFEFDPQVFYGDALNTYIESDPVVGTFIYVIPTVIGVPAAQTDQSEQWVPKNYDAVQLHEKTRHNLKSFSSLQFQYPTDSPFYAMSKEIMGNAAYIFYKKEDPKQDRGPNSTHVSFRLRLSKQPQGKTEIVVVEHYCHYLEGCQFKTTERHYNHLEPYAYCYYYKKIQLDLPDKRKSTDRSIPVRTNPPESMVVDEQQDVLE